MSSQTRARCSLTVRTSKRTSNCWQRPKDCLTESISFTRSAPYIEAFPEEGFKIPVIMFKTVVFPAPLCPRRQKTSFCFIDNDSLFTAVKFPNFLVRF